MAKGRDAQKSPEKKKSDKTLKEKRAEKKEKKLKNAKNQGQAQLLVSVKICGRIPCIFTPMY